MNALTFLSAAAIDVINLRYTMLKPKTWAILQQAVEEGVRYGYNRAHKHVDLPTEDEICTEIEKAVLNSISEWFEVVEYPDQQQIKDDG